MSSGLCTSSKAACPGSQPQTGLVSRTPKVTLDSRGKKLNKQAVKWPGAQLQVSEAFSRMNHMQNQNLKLEYLSSLAPDTSECELNTKYSFNCFLCYKVACDSRKRSSCIDIIRETDFKPYPQEKQ